MSFVEPEVESSKPIEEPPVDTKESSTPEDDSDGRKEPVEPVETIDEEPLQLDNGKCCVICAVRSCLLCWSCLLC